MTDSAVSAQPDLIERLDSAYRERDQLVAALSKHYESHLAIDEAVDDRQWQSFVCVHLPTGQVTWHIHSDELPLFAHLEDKDRLQHRDGHGADEKYARLNALQPRRR